MNRGGARARVNVDRSVVLERPGALRNGAGPGLFESLETALFLVDGNNLLWRAAHGYPAPFTADDGRDLTTPFRFFSLLRRALGTWGLFAECVVCFDGPAAWSARLDVDPTYKANRRYDTKDLSFIGWLPEIRSALEASGVACMELEDQEADDVIASIAEGVGSRPVRVLSTDRDYFQLLSATVSVVNPKSQPRLVDADLVSSRFGVSPGRWCDFRALAGDQSDGIPGVSGVGPKRAAEMLAGGRRLEDLPRDSLDAAQWTDVLRWRDLIRLRRDVPVGYEPRGEPTPSLPGPVTVCRELGVIAR